MTLRSLEIVYYTGTIRKNFQYAHAVFKDREDYFCLELDKNCFLKLFRKYMKGVVPTFTTNSHVDTIKRVEYRKPLKPKR